MLSMRDACMKQAAQCESVAVEEQQKHAEKTVEHQTECANRHQAINAEHESCRVKEQRSDGEEVV